jgi:hypothetical protein
MICQLATLMQRGPKIERRWAAVLFTVTALSAPLSGWADDDANKPPPEIDWQLPATPAAADMVPFFQSPLSKQSFAIDAKSLTVDKDGVVRYTIVGTSTGGAKNVSYEGIRCSTFEKRLYALGHSDGSWAKARDSEWQAIPTSGMNTQHEDLAQNYLCSGTTIAGTAEQILQNLRYHKTAASGRL